MVYSIIAAAIAFVLWLAYRFSVPTFTFLAEYLQYITYVFYGILVVCALVFLVCAVLEIRRKARRDKKW